MSEYTYEDIAAKAEWEGGLDDALDWFQPEEVPEDIRTKWHLAKVAKKVLEDLLDQIGEYLPE
jgi:hypothetical protein